MAVETLADAASFHAYMHKKITGRVASAPAALNWRPAAHKWTPLEHLEHVAITDGILLDHVEAMIARAKARGLTATPETPRVVDALPALQAAGAGQTPNVAPEESCPTGASLEDVLAMLAASRARHQALLPQLEEIDTNQLRTPLPVTGVPCNLGQWYHFMGIHIAHHDRLVQAVLAAHAG